MNHSLVKFWATLLLCILTRSGGACTIFMANDGQQVWIGNNEDERPDLRYRLWFYPAQRASFGYLVWSELSMGKLLNGFSYINPQGGLNEYGLFMDYTFIDPIPVDRLAGKQDRKKQVVTDILRTCKTVEEALRFLEKYNLVKLNSAQLFIGDASGDYAIVTGASVTRKTGKGYALTNYCIANGHQEACHRRDVATRYLNASAPYGLEAIRSILDKSAQKGPNNLISNYSMAIDLKAATIYLYYKTDFTTVAVLNLKEELRKGKHHRDMETCFPERIRPMMEKLYRSSGIKAVIEKYSALRMAGSQTYNFRNDDMLRLSIQWIGAGKAGDALRLLNCLRDFDAANPAVDAWRGVAYRMQERLDSSAACFSKVLAQDPDNYLATLWGRQQQQTLTFKLADYEAAEQVFLMGKFTEWTKHPIPMKRENGYWACTVSLPKGPQAYKFIVNNQYLADSRNYLHTGSGPDVFSMVYVW